MAPAGPAAAMAAIFPPRGAGRQVYAVLDGARDPRTETLARLWSAQYAPLSGDRVGPQLRAASAFLVTLDPAREETEVLVHRVWGQSSAVFLEVEAGTGFAALQRRLRRLLRVLDPVGNILTFRWYDPRVARAFLPTVDATQREEVFGPVLRWVVEDASGVPLEFRAG